MPGRERGHRSWGRQRLLHAQASALTRARRAPAAAAARRARRPACRCASGAAAPQPWPAPRVPAEGSERGTRTAVGHVQPYARPCTWTCTCTCGGGAAAVAVSVALRAAGPCLPAQLAPRRRPRAARQQADMAAPQRPRPWPAAPPPHPASPQPCAPENTPWSLEIHTAHAHPQASLALSLYAQPSPPPPTCCQLLLPAAPSSAAAPLAGGLGCRPPCARAAATAGVAAQHAAEDSAGPLRYRTHQPCLSRHFVSTPIRPLTRHASPPPPALAANSPGLTASPV
jgi:hypothetical protein